MLIEKDKMIQYQSEYDLGVVIDKNYDAYNKWEQGELLKELAICNKALELSCDDIVEIVDVSDEECESVFGKDNFILKQYYIHQAREEVDKENKDE